MEMMTLPTGEVTVTLSRGEYEDLVDARDHALAMRDVAAGRVPLLSGDEVDAYMEAPTPLAFWRRHRKLSQKELAQAIEVSQPFIAQMEHGQKDASITIYNRLARILGVRIEDLIPE
jgi:DNA-binding XRE family transcriptional regulator